MLATANTGEIGRGFGKNAGEWTRSVEISKEIQFLAVSVHTDLGKALKEECLCSVFSPDGTLISATAGPHCEAQRANPEHLTIILQQSYNNLTIISVRGKTRPARSVAGDTREEETDRRKPARHDQGVLSLRFCTTSDS